MRIFLTGGPHIKEDIQKSCPKAVVIPVSPINDIYFATTAYRFLFFCSTSTPLNIPKNE